MNENPTSPTPIFALPPADAATWVAARRRQDSTDDMTMSLARNFGPLYVEQVKLALAAPTLNTMRAINAEGQRQRKKMMDEAGIEPTRIPRKEFHMTNAVQTMFRHVDDGRKPSALAAASHEGLDKSQSNKLAYKSPLKKALVRKAVERSRGSAFVQRLLTDAGLADVVIDGHVSLSKLAAHINNANRSLSQRVNHLEAAITVLLVNEAERDGGNSRGQWHVAAMAYRRQGESANKIARRLGKSVGAVKKALGRYRAEGADVLAA